tara:strand:+ start:2190 stop:2396 length:207 start_codon:yes stop_codon:yes gene_type:complete
MRFSISSTNRWLPRLKGAPEWRFFKDVILAQAEIQNVIASKTLDSCLRGNDGANEKRKRVGKTKKGSR